MDDPICKLCKWYRSKDDEALAASSMGSGNCRKRCPVVITISKDVSGFESYSTVVFSPKTQWPQVMGTDWCGEFESL